MTTLSYSPQSDHHGKTEHRVVITKPVIVLSVLAMVGLLGAVAAVSVKLMKWYGKAVSGEKRPLLEDRLVQFSNIHTHNSMVVTIT